MFSAQTVLTQTDKCVHDMVKTWPALTKQMLTHSMQTASDALPDTQTQKAAWGYKSSGTQKQPEEKNGEKKIYIKNKP